LTSNNGADATTVSEMATASVNGRDESPAVVDETTTKPTNAADDTGDGRCLSTSGSTTLSCRHDDGRLPSAFRCRQDRDEDGSDAAETVVARLARNSTSDDAMRNCDDTDVGGGRAEVDDDEDEAWTTTSGSYNAVDLCDEFDQLFFGQNPASRQNVAASYSK